MFGLQINRNLPVSIANQLCEQLRRSILKGELKQGERLPASRFLARELNISRNIIIQVYEQLLAEGYLESRLGAGTFVAGIMEYRPGSAGLETGPSIEHRTARSKSIYFHAGNPDSSYFPRLQWAKLYKRVCLESGKEPFEYGAMGGEGPLRSALAEYLFRIKGISCTPEQIIIVSGASRGIELIARTICPEGGCAVIEDPSIDYIQNILRNNRIGLLPVPVDQDGIITERLPEDANVNLAYIVPSHQYPIGGVLPIARRLQLLEYVQRKKAYVIEDDYDSEFRYQGEPIQSLRHLDPNRVIYLGTLSKILSPGLRLGYIIFPLHLVERALTEIEKLNLKTSTLEQLTLANFISTGCLDKHVYRMKKVYQAKLETLAAAIEREFGDKMVQSGTRAGLHMLVTYCRDFSQEDFIRLKEIGVEADWVEHYTIVKGLHKNRLVLGYGNLDIHQINEGVKRLRQGLERNI